LKNRRRFEMAIVYKNCDEIPFAIESEIETASIVPPAQILPAHGQKKDGSSCIAQGREKNEVKKIKTAIAAITGTAVGLIIEPIIEAMLKALITMIK
jgi:hypothetical protein